MQCRQNVAWFQTVAGQVVGSLLEVQPLSLPLTEDEESRLTILVVDDDAEVRASLAELLQLEGYDVVALPNANVALSHLCQNPPPALVLVDLLMPGMNAWELMAQMRMRDKLAKVPLVAMTGAGPQWGAPVPGSLVLRKPIAADRLLEVVRAQAKPPG